jgi:hypothetical protein
MPTKLPFTDGRLVTSRLVTLPPICFDVTSTSGVAAVTVTVSVRPPTSSGRSSVVVRPESSWMPDRLYFLKPGDSATSV